MPKRIVVKIDTGDPAMDEKIEASLRGKIWIWFQEYFGVDIKKEAVTE